jgi:MoxR-like ATPase
MTKPATNSPSKFSGRFDGSQSYVATDDLKLAVNAAMALQRPLLIKGEPGTGKTMLAEEVAAALNMPLLQWHIKSTTKAQQGLYEYDAVSRLRDSQLGDEKVKDIRNYIVKGVLWQAFEADQPTVLLIDEIDKADIEFPNDLLHEIDHMEFYVCETRELIKAKHRPLVIITSNNEKGLPDLKKKPSTSELIDWLKLLLAEDIPPEALFSEDEKIVVPPLHGALLKNEQDVHLFERLVMMNRNHR